MAWRKEKLAKGKMQKKELLEYILIVDGVRVAQVWHGHGGRDWYWMVTGEGTTTRKVSTVRHGSMLEAQRACESWIESIKETEPT